MVSFVVAPTNCTDDDTLRITTHWQMPSHPIAHARRIHPSSAPCMLAAPNAPMHHHRRRPVKRTPHRNSFCNGRFGRLRGPTEDGDPLSRYPAPVSHAPRSSHEHALGRLNPHAYTARAPSCALRGRPLSPLATPPHAHPHPHPHPHLHLHLHPHPHPHHTTRHAHQGADPSRLDRAAVRRDALGAAQGAAAL